MLKKYIKLIHDIDQRDLISKLVVVLRFAFCFCVFLLLLLHNLFPFLPIFLKSYEALINFDDESAEHFVDGVGVVDVQHAVKKHSVRVALRVKLR